MAKAKTEKAKTNRFVQRGLHLFQPNYKFWNTQVSTCSALSGDGIDNIWNAVEKFITLSKTNNHFESNRHNQNLTWFDNILAQTINQWIFEKRHSSVDIASIKKDVLTGKLTPSLAV
ncbi:MAG: hypothetical protein IID54_05015, partial [Proteobacteria bacterium]|nr:hypothetical protein [Pseudomonadota bacterium]